MIIVIFVTTETVFTEQRWWCGEDFMISHYFVNVQMYIMEI